MYVILQKTVYAKFGLVFPRGVSLQAQRMGQNRIMVQHPRETNVNIIVDEDSVTVIEE